MIERTDYFQEAIRDIKVRDIVSARITRAVREAIQRSDELQRLLQKPISEVFPETPKQETQK